MGTSSVVNEEMPEIKAWKGSRLFCLLEQMKPDTRVQLLIPAAMTKRTELCSLCAFRTEKSFSLVCSAPKVRFLEGRDD